ncbi:MAG: GntR family transcriptional regulator [Desulfobacteraceae bacterium]|nr:MAG: GntR family transcriptional regulator [Desulfobacteraceae bacterium]
MQMKISRQNGNFTSPGKKIRLSIKPPVSIREKVYRSIREGILNGTFTQGERLIESRLAHEIHTSRTPVREALHTLEREGLLESIPRVGYRVKKIRWSEVEEICEIRTVNEILAARWAMERMTPEQLRALEENIAASKREVLQDENPRSFVYRDAEFHELLASASGSSRLLELCQLLRRHMLRYRMESLYKKETALEAIDWHTRILECLKNKDEKGIAKAIRSHLEFAKKSIQSQVPWKERE